MPVPSPESRTPLPAEPDGPEVTVTRPRTRRALLAGLAGGAGVLIADALGRIRPVRGVVASNPPLLLGTDNYAGSTATRLHATSSGGAFWMTQNGSGSGVRGDSTNGTGAVFTTAHKDRYGLLVQQNATSTGNGAGIRVAGGKVHGLVATTADVGRTAVTATNADATADNVAVMGLAFNASSADTHPAATVSFFKAAGEFAGVTGVIGAATAAVPGAYGVVGISPGSSGAGVYGLATSSSGATSGVYGQTVSTTNYAAGVSGFATATGATVYGVHGASLAARTDAAGVIGIGNGSGSNGLWGQCTTPSGYGVYGVGASDGEGVYGQGGLYGVYSAGNLGVNGDLTVTGSKAGYVVDVAVNGGSTTLHQGDPVTVIGARAPVLGSIPLLVVGPANQGDSVVGVVDRRVEVTSPSSKHHGSQPDLKASGTDVEPGAHLYVVTLGAFAVGSVEATGGAIQPGDRLAVGAKGRLAKAMPIQVNGRSMFPAGEQVGYALGEHATSDGKIGIFVNPH